MKILDMLFSGVQLVVLIIAVQVALPGGWLIAAEVDGSRSLESLEQRISNPDLSKRFKTRVYRGATSANLQQGEIPKKEYYWIKKSLTKEYQTGEYYSGQQRQRKAAWIKGKQYRTGKAYLNRSARDLNTAASQYRTSNYRTGAATTGGTQQPVTQTDDAQREFTARGTAQGALDRLANNPQQLTVDQLREILNRSE